MTSPFSTSVPSSAPQSPVLVLEVCQGNTCSARRAVQTPRFLIGSGALCDLRLDDPSIPTLHSLVQLDGQTAWLDTLVSSPPLIVNGQVRHSALLEDGDLIEIGEIRLRAHCPSALKESTPAQPHEGEQTLVPASPDALIGETGGEAPACETEHADIVDDSAPSASAAEPRPLNELFGLLRQSREDAHAHATEPEDAASAMPLEDAPSERTAAELVELIEQEELLIEELQHETDAGLPALMQAVKQRAAELAGGESETDRDSTPPLHRLRLVVPEDDLQTGPPLAAETAESRGALPSPVTSSDEFQHEMELVVRQLSEVSAELERRSQHLEEGYTKPLREMLAEQQDLSARLDGLLKRMHQLAEDDDRGDDQRPLRAVA